MTKRSPNRRKKSPRKSSAQDTTPDMHYQDTSNGQVGYPSYNMPAFSEDSIQRQLGYMIPLPQPAAYLYTHTHPVTGEEFAVWYDGRYAYGEEDYLYGRKHEDGCERFYHEGDCVVRPGHDLPPVDVQEDYSYGREHRNGCERFYHQGDCIVHHECFPSEDNASPPRYRYVEGYHDPILKGLAPDWWRLFGHDVPKQFILSPTSAEGPGAGSQPSKVEGKEKDGEWDAAAYFGPYRASDTEACRGPERVYGEEEAKRKDEREDREHRADGSTTKKPTGGSKRECRGRDDWECDFCGPECFCWTVKAEKRPADDIQTPRMRLYNETCLSVRTTTGRS